MGSEKCPASKKRHVAAVSANCAVKSSGSWKPKREGLEKGEAVLQAAAMTTASAAQPKWQPSQTKRQSWISKGKYNAKRPNTVTFSWRESEKEQIAS